ncbi:MAG: beta-ketoacyl-ACP synthase II [Planctomycetaceae bacterium]|nr:beta-ketoacyl-ACP synthase II [Planctomycetaceae bacterium]
MKRRVVVTGLGVVTAVSCQVNDLWQRILAGESGVHLVRLCDTSDLKVKIGGDIYDWNPSAYIDAKEAKRIDRFTQFALVAGADALRDSGLDLAQEDTYRCGVVLGSGIGGLCEIESQMSRLMTKGPDRVSAFTVPKMMLNAAGSMLSIVHGIRGPNYAVATACASATNAMADALKLIQDGRADVIVTGGTEAAITRMGISAFQNIKALSMRNDDPAGASRPFDADRDGFVFSEGAGLLIFEELEHARARDANIYCEVFGAGVSTDAGHITQPDENGAGAARAISNAVLDSQIELSDIDYINAHGTGTELNDRAETMAIKQVFGDHAKKVSISSTKSQLGHTLGASGGIELVITIKALQERVVPPTINLETPDPLCDLDYTPLQPRERDIKVAMSNSFGFGGHNACIVVGHLRNGTVQ